MKKMLLITVFTFCFIHIFTLTAYCVDGDFIDNAEDKLFSIIDYDTEKILEDLGIDGLNFENINQISFKSIVNYFADDLETKVKNVLKFVLIQTAVILFLSSVVVVSESKNKDVIEFAAVISVVLISSQHITSLLNASLSVIDASSKFMLGYIPIFASLIAFSASAATALSYNTLLLTVSQGISWFVSNFALKITGGFFAMSISFSLSENISLSRFSAFFSKFTSYVIGFLSSIFAAFLTVKSVFYSSVDTVSAKGIRFVISNFIPVVGSAISDAYSTVLGSIGIIKGSVAIVGILVAVILNLPTVFEGMCYCLALNFLSFVSQILNCEKISALLKAFSIGIKFILLIQIFMLFILIVSTAVMVNVKSNL